MVLRSPRRHCAMRDTMAVEAVSAFECLDDVVHSPPRTMHPNKRPASLVHLRRGTRG